MERQFITDMGDALTVEERGEDWQQKHNQACALIASLEQQLLAEAQKSEKYYAALYMDRCEKWADLKEQIASLKQENAGLKKAHKVLQRHPDVVNYYEGMLEDLEQENEKLKKRIFDDRSPWPEAVIAEINALEDKHDLWLVSGEYHAGWVKRCEALEQERDVLREALKKLKARPMNYQDAHMELGVWRRTVCAVLTAHREGE